MGQRDPSRTAAMRNQQSADPVNPHGGVVKQRGALTGRIFLADPFETVPKIHVGSGELLHREIAFEHATIGAQIFNAPLEVRS